MTTPVWQAGTIYAPGALVQPASTPAPQPDQITNGDFESGNTGWTLAAGFSIGQFGTNTHFQGTWSLQWDTTGEARAVNNNATAVVAGQTINATAQVQQGASSAGQAGARVEVLWYDASDEFISESQGNLVDSASNNTWKQSSVAAVAPANAAFARFSIAAFRASGSNKLWVDTCSWDAAVTSIPDGLVFRAVQAVAGYSGASEPVWPLSVGLQVIDNEVTWEAVIASRVTWEASPILVSGSYEPSFPELPDATVADGTILWTAMNWRVSQAPHSKVVAIGASKIFAADEDIISFSATVNPLDWTTAEDAGYIPFGLNTFGSTPVTALGLYRSNLVAFNSEAYQMWQIDEDPANMAILDASPVACLFPKSVQPVSNDLVMCTPEGVRNIGIAGASTNLQAGYFGAQVDPLVLAKIRAGLVPFALFWPSMGQYWLIFETDDGSEAFVLTMNGGAKDQSWSRYLFAETLTDWAILDGDLYLRTEDRVWRVDPEALEDDENSEVSAAFTMTAGMETGIGLTYIGADIIPVISPPTTIGSVDPEAVAGLLIGSLYVAVSAFPDLAAGTIVFELRSSEGGDPGGTAFGSISFTDELGVARTFARTDAQNPDGDPVDVGFGVQAREWSWTITPPAEIFDDAGTYEVTLNLGDSGGNGQASGTVCDGGLWESVIGCESTSPPVIFDAGVYTFDSADLPEDRDVYWLGLEAIPTSLPFIYAVTTDPDPGDTLYFWYSEEPFAANPIFTALTESTDTITVVPTDTGFFAFGISTSNSDRTVMDSGIVTISCATSETGTPFEGYIAWPYLDFGLLGIDKMMEGFDIVADGTFRVSFGYSQRDFSLATDEYALDGDTVTGSMVPMPLTAPSFQMRITFDGSQAWEWFASNIYINNEGTG